MAVAYSVAVTSPGAGTATGNVTVTASTGEMCTGTVAAGTCNITFTTAQQSRLRAVFAARKQTVAAYDPSALVTIHGLEGAPPEESDMKKFKMIVPMRPDERLEAEKAGKGTTKVRKG